MADQDGSVPLPRFDRAPPRLCLVAAPFYRAITDDLIRGAAEVLDGFGAPYDLVEVPGALEIAPAIGFAGRRYEGYVALGCVIRGETSHYELVCAESARGLTLLGVERGFCIGNGVLTCESRAQAEARADPNGMDKGGGAAVAALHLIALARRFADPAPVSLREDGAAYSTAFGD
jgi:6,7-dimethyl-8-ribityllumazine synthase